MKYFTGIDAGDGFFPIDEFSDESKAIERIAEYYDEDRVNGCFEDGVYSIEEVDNSGVVVYLYKVRESVAALMAQKETPEARHDQ